MGQRWEVNSVDDMLYASWAALPYNVYDFRSGGINCGNE